ncbi:MAG: DUF5020 family protein [Bacteroidaceae bacterium]|nr:DUF5020 family protein [Bacteroidaceae bacterium]
MKKVLFSALLVLASLPAFAQLNVQMHYDFAKALYGSELDNRPRWTATIENFKADKWGSTYFFVDGNFADNTLESAYAEFARELRFWEAPLAVHVEYNGGLSGNGSYNDAYLAGGAWNWANKDFSKTFSLQLLYKYLARQQVGSKHSWQVTTVWGIHFANGLYTFSGYADLWHDGSVKGNLMLSSEPQFWFNLAALDSVDDDFKLSLGAELELSKGLVWPTDGMNDRFYAIPTLAAKWTF